MPNHCWNHLTVIGHSEDLDVLEKSEFKFGDLLPIPTEVQNTPTGRECVDWCVQHWGTKWDRWDYDRAYRCTYEISLSFNTAWNPPFGYLRQILHRFPRSWIKLDFRTEANEAGVWIAYKWKDELIERKMFWNEPVANLNYNADIVIPHDLDVTDI